MADAPGIKLFGATIAIKEIRQVIKDEETKDHDDQTIEKRPEKIIQCPRCKSMETKFCYFNNYNVNQPRHFCKGCQRYWTAGGALRNVPVGAGRRKTKPPGSGMITGFSESRLFDSSGVLNRFDFDGLVEEWHVAENGSFREVFPAKRRKNTSVYHKDQ